MKPILLFASLALLPPVAALAANDPSGWQACSASTDPAARLACYDGWARRQAVPAAAPAAVPTPPTEPEPAAPELPALQAAEATLAQPSVRCGSQPASSELSRYWDLENASGCGVFGIRIYRPIQLALVKGNSVNRQPTSENPANDVATAEPYRTTETRIQLSIRTKIAEGLLTPGGTLRDSLWFGYTQQSYWQLFTPSISRPFRNTDHEPELMYVYPLAGQSVGDWTVRYGGLGLVHQSNGQSLPRSRSWNRVYLMAGADHPSGMTLQARVWQRLHEAAGDDDNPRISDYVGRAELVAGFKSSSGQSLALTWRTPLRGVFDRGSTRLDWMVPLDSADEPGQFGRLRVHTQLFNGYGDSLLDYNRRRTVLSVGLSLVDW
ncbi:MAG: phospholipase A [Ramlibacter sp.]